MKTLSIVGAGKVGSTLARAWVDTDTFELQEIFNRTPVSTARAVAFVGAGRAVSKVCDLQPVDVWMLSLPDSQIAPMCTRLVDAECIRRDNVVFHCSGALDAEVLATAATAGAHTASIHPLKSFAQPSDALQDFAGTWCAVQGNDTARATLDPALERIGGRIFALETGTKCLYHAGSVFASNYLVALLEVSLGALSASGVQRQTALQLLEPLVRGTVDNVFSRDTEIALTGPIARGDHELVAHQHGVVCAWNEEHARLYALLGMVALRLSEAKGDVDSADLAKLETLLTSQL